uniref:Endodeoxyribonuclease RusA n=1 Tax=Clostridioides difficile TaxID=1496 RepID=A0A386JC48_CLODI|nr:hypothetical protein [Clostridioides difficile]AYD68705.1 Endodeoxyribonuclease RusA [Clostridioides difficile]
MSEESYIIDHSLKDIRDKINLNNGNIFKALETLENTKYHLVQQIMKNEQVAERLELDDVSNYSDKLIEVNEYVENKKIKIWTDMLPPNLFSVESSRYYSDYKELIQQLIIYKLSGFNEHFNKIIIKYKLYLDYLKYDVDNYFFKTYTDAIMKSNLIKDDNFEQVKILMTGESSENIGLEITIYNQDFSLEYVNEICIL